MITFNWTISQLDSKSVDGFVTTAHWRCDATDGNYFVGCYGATNWSEGAPTIPYADLTQTEVLTWVWEIENKENIEASLTSEIKIKQNPVLISGLPWKIN